MRRGQIFLTLVLACAAAALFAAFAVGRRSSAELVVATLALAIGALLIVRQWLADRRLSQVRRRLETLHGVGALPLDTTVAEIERQWAKFEHRLSVAHPTSGLLLREDLILQMQRSQRGLIAAVSLVDFERLTAFDPALGERTFVATVDRLRAMLPADQIIAQVDRGQIAIWFGETPEPNAIAALDAISYALSGCITDGAEQITPQIRTRLDRFDADGDLTATAFLSRALAGLQLPDDKSQSATGQAHPNAIIRDRFSLEQDLRLAVMRHELRLDFQPLIDADRRCVTGAEALVRWDHPVRGAISPSQFIPIAEEIGLAGEIGVWALNCAVREARGWSSIGCGPLRVAVNVSAMQLRTKDLPVLVERTLARHGLGPNTLEIELTESAAADQTGNAGEIFAALRQMGIKLTVDDFGTGFSGFSSLRQLQFDKIKIDREFVTEVDRRPVSQAICQSIIALGRGLDVEVLAEGVERREEYHWLRAHHCSHFQGYLFAKPMSGAPFRSFLVSPTSLAGILGRPSPSLKVANSVRSKA